MRSLDRLTIAGLLLLGFGLCLANVWAAAARSTIPLAIHGQVTKKQIGTEKHPGVDDAYVITLDNSRALRIDGALFERIATGDNLAKQAWQHEIDIAGQSVALEWSRDFYGLIWCMALAVVIMGAMFFFAPQRHLSPLP